MAASGKRLALTDVWSLPDVMSNGSFYFAFDSVPNGAKFDTSGLASTAIALRVQTITSPGVNNAAYDVTLHGHKMNFRGVGDQGHDLSVTFVETVDMWVHKTMKAWHELVVGSNTGTSKTYKGTAGGKLSGAGTGYSRHAKLYQYDVTGALANITQFYAMFPSNVEDSAYDGANEAAMTVSVTFKYDRTDDSYAGISAGGSKSGGQSNSWLWSGGKSV